MTGLKPIGGTAIGEALARALALRGQERADEARPFLVMFLTDGLPTVGETREDAACRAGEGGGSRQPGSSASASART